MAINFPISPVNGQTFTDTTTGLRYVYVASGSYWKSNGVALLGNSVSSQVIFNDSGIANGTNGLVYIKSSNTFYANTINVTGYLYGNGSFLTGVVSQAAPGAGYFQGNNGNTGNLTAGTGDIFRVHSNTLTQNVTITTGNNAVAVGPLTIATNRTLTIQTGARASIV